MKVFYTLIDEVCEGVKTFVHNTFQVSLQLLNGLLFIFYSKIEYSIIQTQLHKLEEKFTMLTT